MRTQDDLELELDRCTDCGLCLASCPTFAAGRHEGDSPRGRVHLTRRVLTGDSDPVAWTHLAGCVECDACHAPCPTGVRFGAVRRTHRRLRHDGADPGAFSRRMRALDDVLAGDAGADLSVHACEVLLAPSGRRPARGPGARRGLLPLVPVLLWLAAPDLTRRIDRMLRAIPSVLVDPELTSALDRASGLFEDAGLFEQHERALEAVRRTVEDRHYEQVTVAAFDGVALRLRGMELPPEISVVPAPDALVTGPLVGAPVGTVLDTVSLWPAGVPDDTTDPLPPDLLTASTWAPLTREALTALASLVEAKRRRLDGRPLLTGDARSLVRFGPSVHDAHLLASMLERSHR